MDIGKAFERLVELMARLRAPDGCPWDREQTLSSLRPFILEEAYELVDAIDQSFPEAVREELGDLLLEVLFVSQICSEQSQFTLGEVLNGLENKLIRRHPHVFQSEKARSPADALARWEQMKAQETSGGHSVLRDVPRALPSLMRAYKLSDRAAREGFDWSSADAVLEKISEEILEVRKARDGADTDALAEEVGDLLFAVVNLARHLGVDPELALHSANGKFVKRFRLVEQQLKDRDRSVAGSTMEELEELWQEAKHKAPKSREIE